MLGELIRRYLDANGIKYNYVAEEIGVTAPVFSAMLNGTRRILAEEYFSICVLLKVSPDFFYKQLYIAS